MVFNEAGIVDFVAIRSSPDGAWRPLPIIVYGSDAASGHIQGSQRSRYILHPALDIATDEVWGLWLVGYRDCQISRIKYLPRVSTQPTLVQDTRKSKDGAAEVRNDILVQPSPVNGLQNPSDLSRRQSSGSNTGQRSYAAICLVKSASIGYVVKVWRAGLGED
ncbi:uncharacterized protein CLUP02_03373 [Colletotrichum lupini]|uniref:Uncharacterized protein n=1 Tax=Colletotrichum lupini TaxID=145971 RepID=A0A9Q8WCS5_9PEZI|nr:uncharacterized protein CLUP02_03373 [Colletotrichum lupini]UQC77900.1 hypothetical protein CLUP02_03373 [Colletotrichum lupini]